MRNSCVEYIHKEWLSLEREELKEEVRTLFSDDHYWFELLARKQLPAMNDKKKLFQLAKKEGGREQSYLADIISTQSPKKILDFRIMRKEWSAICWIASVLFDTHILIVTASRNSKGNGTVSLKSEVVGVEFIYGRGKDFFNAFLQADTDICDRVSDKKDMGFLMHEIFENILINPSSESDKKALLHQVLSQRKSSSEWL